MSQKPTPILTKKKFWEASSAINHALVSWKYWEREIGVTYATEMAIETQKIKMII